MRLTSAIFDRFSWFKRHITPNIGHRSEFSFHWKFSWDCQLGKTSKFVLIYDNPPKCWFDKQWGWQIIFQCQWKRHWIGNFEGKIIVTYDKQPYMTNCMGGKNVFNFRSTTLHFFRLNMCFQFLSNLKFECSSRIFFFIAKNHEKLNKGHFWGIRSGGIFFFFYFVQLCCPRGYYYVSITKISAFNE